jgi:tripeptide aminopeptidase
MVPDVPEPSRERLAELFIDFARLRSPSRGERAVADLVRSRLKAMGVATHEDHAGEATGGTAGNVWCLVQGEGATPHVALGAHMDTVEPTDDIEPVLEDGVFKNARPTILGADDKVAVVALLHATELLLDSGRPFPTYELFFTVSEEIGLVGVKHMSVERLSSPLAAVFDASGPVGGITNRSPRQDLITATFRGRAAHAGVEPERGRSAVQAAAKAVAAMRLGRLDEETSANIGVFEGGVASNIVPDLCVVKGECRGHDDEKLTRVAAEMVDALQSGAAQVGVDVDITLTQEYSGFALAEDSPVVRWGRAAVSALGLEPRTKAAGGGSDANILNARGLPTVNMDSGMMQVHSPDEYVTLDELERLCALTLNMIMLAPGYATDSEEAHPGGVDG